MEIAPLTRQISQNVSKQHYGDCFAHAIARIIVKVFRKQYPDTFNIHDDISDTCNILYQHSNDFFYDCKNKVCKKISLLELRGHCNPIELNSLALYMYIYSIIVNKYGCEGEDTYHVLKFVLDILYNEEFLTSKCLIHPDLCEIIIPILIDHIHSKKKYTLKHNTYKYLGYPAYPTTQQKIMLNRMVNPAIYFFDAIQHTIDNELYLVLSINGSFLKWKESNPGKTYTSDIGVTSQQNHAVPIVNYDYSLHKSFTIKNSWSKETALIDISEEELLALSQHTWIISICYLDEIILHKPFIVGGKKRVKSKKRLKKL